jgi:2-polyprenyl-3-methyl-5-hydroxy-6-metoxy-1,4-benzoquinol methylase
MMDFPSWATERGIVFSSALSLGCGGGRLERAWMKRGLLTRCHGLDISEEAIQVARDMAAKEGLDLTYSQADLNFVSLEPETYDLVIAQTSMHHYVRLERIADEINRALRPGGLLWVHDYVGETQLQHDDVRIELVNRILVYYRSALRGVR